MWTSSFPSWQKRLCLSTCRVSVGPLRHRQWTHVDLSQEVWLQQEVLIFKGLAAEHNNAYLWLVWAWPRKPATFRHANCRVVSRKGVAARGEGSVRAFRRVWLCAVCSLSMSLSDCVFMHMTRLELEMQTFTMLLNRPQNTAWGIFDVIYASWGGFSFPRFCFKNVLEERWMWITRWVKCVKLKETVLWPCTRMSVQMRGHYGCKALERNTSLGLFKFCKWLRLMRASKNHSGVFFTGEIHSCVLYMCLEWTETKSEALCLEVNVVLYCIIQLSIYYTLHVSWG